MVPFAQLRTVSNWAEISVKFIPFDAFINTASSFCRYVCSSFITCSFFSKLYISFTVFCAILLMFFASSPTVIRTSILFLFILISFYDSNHIFICLDNPLHILIQTDTECPDTEIEK